MRKIFTLIIFLALVAVIIFGYVNYVFYWAQPEMGAPAVKFEIKKGESIAVIAKNLKAQNLLGNTWLFRAFLKAKKLDKNIPAGEFSLQEGMSYSALAGVLANPEQNLIKLLFREGENLRDYGAILEKGNLLDDETFQKVTGAPAVDYRFAKTEDLPQDFSADFDFLADKPKYLSLEGYLFPDTYFFRPGETAENIARFMLVNFGKKLTPEIREEIKKQGKSIHEIITMASIVEAEARNLEDRKIVAGILWKRESIGMALQVDSSVNYITGGNKPAINSDEQKIDSLYNTYKYPGLPPGPINNPGIEAIEAAIYPTPSDYWFFLTGKDGKMYYAKNLDEHNENKYKYLK